MSKAKLSTVFCKQYARRIYIKKKKMEENFSNKSEFVFSRVDNRRKSSIFDIKKKKSFSMSANADGRRESTSSGNAEEAKFFVNKKSMSSAKLNVFSEAENRRKLKIFDTFENHRFATNVDSPLNSKGPSALADKENLYTSYSKLLEVKLINVSIASPEKIRQWAEKTLPNGKVLGQVTNANTLHHKTFKPQKGGLFCERIFGPIKDFECACGKRKKPNEEEQKKILEHQKTERKFCPECDVEYTWSVIRRYQLGYIQLVSPVTHIWYLKSLPSYLSILLDMKKKYLEYIVYCTENMTLENAWKSQQNYTLTHTPSSLFLSWQSVMQNISIPSSTNNIKISSKLKSTVLSPFSYLLKPKVSVFCETEDDRKSTIFDKNLTSVVSYFSSKNSTTVSANADSRRESTDVFSEAEDTRKSTIFDINSPAGALHQQIVESKTFDGLHFQTKKKDIDSRSQLALANVFSEAEDGRKSKIFDIKDEDTARTKIVDFLPSSASLTTRIKPKRWDSWRDSWKTDKIFLSTNEQRFVFCSALHRRKSVVGEVDDRLLLAEDKIFDIKDIFFVSKADDRFLQAKDIVFSRVENPFDCFPQSGKPSKIFDFRHKGKSKIFDREELKKEQLSKAKLSTVFCKQKTTAFPRFFVGYRRPSTKVDIFSKKHKRFTNVSLFSAKLKTVENRRFSTYKKNGNSLAFLFNKSASADCFFVDFRRIFKLKVADKFKRRVHQNNGRAALADNVENLRFSTVFSKAEGIGSSAENRRKSKIFDNLSETFTCLVQKKAILMAIQIAWKYLYKKAFKISQYKTNIIISRILFFQLKKLWPFLFRFKHTYTPFPCRLTSTIDNSRYDNTYLSLHSVKTYLSSIPLPVFLQTGTVSQKMSKIVDFRPSSALLKTNVFSRAENRRKSKIFDKNFSYVFSKAEYGLLFAKQKEDILSKAKLSTVFCNAEEIENRRFSTVFRSAEKSGQPVVLLNNEQDVENHKCSTFVSRAFSSTYMSSTSRRRSKALLSTKQPSALLKASVIPDLLFKFKMRDNVFFLRSKNVENPRFSTVFSSAENVFSKAEDGLFFAKQKRRHLLEDGLLFAKQQEGIFSSAEDRFLFASQKENIVFGKQKISFNLFSKIFLSKIVDFRPLSASLKTLTCLSKVKLSTVFCKQKTLFHLSRDKISQIINKKYFFYVTQKPLSSFCVAKRRPSSAMQKTSLASLKTVENLRFSTILTQYFVENRRFSTVFCKAEDIFSSAEKPFIPEIPSELSEILSASDNGPFEFKAESTKYFKNLVKFYYRTFVIKAMASAELKNVVSKTEDLFELKGKSTIFDMPKSFSTVSANADGRRESTKFNQESYSLSSAKLKTVENLRFSTNSLNQNALLLAKKIVHDFLQGPSISNIRLVKVFANEMVKFLIKYRFTHDVESKAFNSLLLAEDIVNSPLNSKGPLTLANIESPLNLNGPSVISNAFCKLKSVFRLAKDVDSRRPSAAADIDIFQKFCISSDIIKNRKNFLGASNSCFASTNIKIVENEVKERFLLAENVSKKVFMSKIEDFRRFSAELQMSSFCEAKRRHLLQAVAMQKTIANFRFSTLNHSNRISLADKSFIENRRFSTVFSSAENVDSRRPSAAADIASVFSKAENRRKSSIFDKLFLPKNQKIMLSKNFYFASSKIENGCRLFSTLGVNRLWPAQNLSKSPFDLIGRLVPTKDNNRNKIRDLIKKNSSLNLQPQSSFSVDSRRPSAAADKEIPTVVFSEAEDVRNSVFSKAEDRFFAKQKNKIFDNVESKAFDGLLRAEDSGTDHVDFPQRSALADISYDISFIKKYSPNGILNQQKMFSFFEEKSKPSYAVRKTFTAPLRTVQNLRFSSDVVQNVESKAFDGLLQAVDKEKSNFVGYQPMPTNPKQDEISDFFLFRKKQILQNVLSKQKIFFSEAKENLPNCRRSAMNSAKLKTVENLRFSSTADNVLSQAENPFDCFPQSGKPSKIFDFRHKGKSSIFDKFVERPRCSTELNLTVDSRRPSALADKDRISKIVDFPFNSKRSSASLKTMAGNLPSAKRTTNFCEQKARASMILFNNIYCLSHRFRWDIQKDWQYFLFFISAASTFEDKPIPLYQHRIKYSKNFAKENVLVGAGLIQQLLLEFHFNELKKIDRQNRILLYELNKQVNILKKLVRKTLATRSDKKQLREFFQKRDQLIRRTKLIRKLFRKDSKANLMILSILPVLPPDLRPIIKIQDQIAASDLNRLYQRIIYRNDRLKKFLKDPATSQSYEMKYAQRLLQEAVDNLIENGKGGVVPEKDSRGRSLKSLSDILKGKQGRFRQHLLGKRVDYSGRSVIVVGPKLKIHECGLPKEMAIELFLPFLLKRLINYKMARTVLGAKTILKTNKTLTWQILREVMQNHPILLNRAPTLHRLGIQAFQPILIEGRAILLHPLVCPAFNADFDGDQMAVHVPITAEARTEAWKLMFSQNNLLSPATGDPLSLPSQDMILGCYYLTTDSMKFQRGSGLYFSNIEQVMKAFNQKKIDLHAIIWVKWEGLFENGNDGEEPLEMRINPFGYVHEIYLKYQCRYDPQGLIVSQIIRTTPGRIFFNLMVRQCV